MPAAWPASAWTIHSISLTDGAANNVVGRALVVAPRPRRLHDAASRQLGPRIACAVIRRADPPVQRPRRALPPQRLGARQGLGRVDVGHDAHVVHCTRSATESMARIDLRTGAAPGSLQGCELCAASGGKANRMAALAHETGCAAFTRGR